MKFKTIYIWYSIPVLVIAIWIVAVFIPLNKQIRLKAMELAAIKAEAAKVDSETRNLIDMKTRNEQVKSSVTEMQNEIPSINHFSGFIPEFIEKTRKDSVILTSLVGDFTTLEGKSSQQALLYPVFDVGLKGRYVDMGRLLQEMTERKACKGVIKARITFDEGAYPDLSGIFTVEFRARRSGNP